MNVTIKQLQAFVAVAKSRSFAEACALVHLSQPALSIAIKNLEEAVGGKLLERTTRSVALTTEGAEFYPVVQRLLSDWDGALEDVHNLFALRRGKLDIAAMPTFASSLLPEILADYHRQFSDINVTVHDVIAESVVDMVRSGRVELGVTFDPGEAQDLDFQPLFRDKMVAVLPKQHPLLKKTQLKWRELQNYPYIALQRPSSIRLLVDQILQDHDIALTPAFEAHQLASIGRMVTAGLGISTVPALSSGQMMEMGAECRPVTAPVITRKVGVITRKRYPLSVAAEAMIKVIAQWNSPGAGNVAL
ncbi:MAG: LysR family transcriptional regulator [Halioglobus sp.]